MTHLYIEQNTGLTEEVNSSIISKLYELAISGDLDASSDLKGRLHSTVARDVHVAYLNANYPDLHVSADKLYISFEDAEVDRILSQQWGDGSGVSIEDANVRTSIGNYFKNNTSINTFTELGRFLTITTIEQEAFQGCSNLESINLQNIKTIGLHAFEGCSSLQHAFQSTSTETVNVDRASFCGCANLEFPDEFHVQFATYSRNYMENYRTFENCTKLKKLVLHGSNINTGYATFSNCTSLSEIVNSDKIAYIGAWSFNNLPSLYGTLDLSGLIGVGNRNSGGNTPGGQPYFTNMPHVTKIILGGIDNGFTGGTWNFFAWDRCLVYDMQALTTIDLGVLGNKFPNFRDTSNGKNILFNACPNLTTVILRNTSVMPLQYDDIVHPYDIGGSGVTLYVPDAIVNDYKTAAGWSNIANQIKGISELPS